MVAGDVRSGVKVSAAIVHGFLAFLDADGAREAFLPLLSEASRKVFENPPPVDQMVPAAPMGEAIAVLLQACGPGKLAQYGAFSARQITNPMLRPLIAALAPAQGRAEAMLARFTEVLSPILQGARTLWEPRGERAGTLTIAYEKVAPDWPTYVVWQGALAEHLAECGVEARVGTPDIAPDNTSAKYEVRW